uniref:hypothetical protein n=1 Tax=Salmonella sp. s51228 TaxID=3159652 RepID=UPI0039819005
QGLSISGGYREYFPKVLADGTPEGVTELVKTIPTCCDSTRPNTFAISGSGASIGSVEESNLPQNFLLIASLSLQGTGGPLISFQQGGGLKFSILINDNVTIQVRVNNQLQVITFPNFDIKTDSADEYQVLGVEKNWKSIQGVSSQC